MSALKPIEFKNNKLILLDQRYLPNEEIYQNINSLEEGHAAIRDMVVRGAPCIGFTAIYTLALWLRDRKDFSLDEFLKAGEFLITSRPTAVNLEYEVNYCLEMAKIIFDESPENATKVLFDKMVKLGHHKMEQSYEDNLNMAKFAIKELKNIYSNTKLNLMTHCNTGTLACGRLGTALGVITTAAQNNFVNKVWVDETRPYLQGSRLTSFELIKEGIDHDIVVEGAASYLMRNKLVDAIFVGADRITANGDTANKVGTSTLAIVANHYGVPFYVVAPTSSFDLKCKNGDGINIELRDQEEILMHKGHLIASKEASAYNPSFDITPAGIITGIICEKRIFMRGEYHLISSELKEE